MVVDDELGVDPSTEQLIQCMRKASRRYQLSGQRDLGRLLRIAAERMQALTPHAVLRSVLGRPFDEEDWVHVRMTEHRAAGRNAYVQVGSDKHGRCYIVGIHVNVAERGAPPSWSLEFPPENRREACP